MRLNIPQYLKNRMIFTGLILFSSILLMQYFGYDSVINTIIIAGIVGGLSVVFFPNPNTQ